ncbi:MAG: phosphatidylserine decarboxylase [Fluviicola sp.]
MSTTTENKKDKGLYTIPLPQPIVWKTRETAAYKHIEQLPYILQQGNNEVNYISALTELYMEQSNPLRKKTAKYWEPYMTKKKSLVDFFKDWLTFIPVPKNPGLYIEYWDYLVNTNSGLHLANDESFKPWFRTFLNFHSDFINSDASADKKKLNKWKKDTGTTAHPFDINDFLLPDAKSPTCGFESFNQFFLRNVKEKKRPLCKHAGDPKTVVAPCDGGIFFLNRGDSQGNHSANQDHDLPGKSDTFNLQKALPGYGRYFENGPLLDILLWFTDYHHFHAPVSGKVIHHGLYRGSYNYDFGDYDPSDFYAPNRTSDSDRVGWYEKLGKHQRYVWIIDTEDLGLVAMIAIGFWGVGSIINGLGDGTPEIQKGDYMGHFGYGGSSIVLAFSPEVDLEFKVNGTEVSGPDNPTLMKVRECLAKPPKK